MQRIAFRNNVDLNRQTLSNRFYSNETHNNYFETFTQTEKQASN